MRKFAKILLSATLVLLFACGGEKASDNSLECIDYHTYEMVDTISDLGKFYKSKKSVAIKNRGQQGEVYNVSAVEKFGNKLYIFDGSSIAIYDTDGNFVRTLAQNGRGPGEYSLITAFTVDKRGHIFFVNALHTLVEYDANHNYVKTTLLPFGVDSILATSDNNFLIGLSRATAKSYHNAQAVLGELTDTSLNVVKIVSKYPPFTIANNSAFQIGSTSFINTNDGFLYYNQLDDPLLFLSERGDTLKQIKFDFGHFATTKGDRESMLNGGGRDVQSTRILHNPIYINGNYIFGRTHGGGRFVCYFVANKSIKKVYEFPKQRFVGYNKDYIIGVNHDSEDNIVLDIYQL